MMGRDLTADEVFVRELRHIQKELQELPFSAASDYGLRKVLSNLVGALETRTTGAIEEAEQNSRRIGFYGHGDRL